MKAMFAYCLSKHVFLVRQMSSSSFIVKWQSKLTGTSGNGNPVSLEIAKSFVSYLNDKHPDFVNWYEPAK